jgi:TldD protein
MLDQDLVAEVLHVARGGGASWADLFMEDTITGALHVLNGQVKDATGGNNYGVGVRALYGTKVIYAYTNDCSRDGLLAVADAVARAEGNAGLTDSSGRGGLDFRRAHLPRLWEIENLPSTTSKRDKLEIARRAGAAAVGGKVKTVDVRFLDSQRRILVANSDGDWFEDERSYSRLVVNAIAEDGTDRESGHCGPGWARGLECFAGDVPEQIGREAARIANAMLGAAYAPAGTLPVVIGNAWGGVIFHEACGHSLETTVIEKNASQFVGKIGQQVANPLVTAIDDGTIPGMWGSLHCDDEATLVARTTLIKDGILESYMVDRVGELKTGFARTGSGRRQDYTFAPASRMRNTFIDNGSSTPEELIQSVSHGLYARSMGGGSVSPGTGDYNFAVSEAYMIRNGEIAEPVRGASLVGNGAQDLMNIVGVANDLEVGTGGMCGSVSGSIPAGLGQPHILVSQMTVGGRA